MSSRVPSSLLLLSGLVSACGGTAVVESGAGGAGVGAATSSTDVASSSVAESSSVDASATTVGATAAPASATSTATGPSQCDGTGNCGDGGAGCIGCAITLTCAATYDACTGSQECLTYADCAGQCPDRQCLDGCNMSYPEGAALYDALVQCVICDACYFDCDGASAGCVPPG